MFGILGHRRGYHSNTTGRFCELYVLLIAIREIRIVYPDVVKIINSENIFVCKLALEYVFSYNL
jgi:predicted KAP-like P-loop ATPase